MGVATTIQGRLIRAGGVMRDREYRVREFCIRWHESIKQVRKYTGEPYWKHPEAVAAIVRTVPHDDDMVDAAYLHDVVEDTPCTLLTIENEFGAVVADYVWWLTDVSTSMDGNRAVRKQIDRRHTAAAPAKAKTIKLADLIDNSRNIVARDPGFARVYLKEKRLLLDEALRGGDATLWKMADDIVRAHL